MIPFSTAKVIGLFLGSILHGIYLVTIGVCLYAFKLGLPGRPIRKLPWPIASVTLIIYILATTNLILELLGVVNSRFCRQAISGNTGITRDWKGIVIAHLSFAEVMIVDGALIYRCWIVYSQSCIIVIFPIIVWILTVAGVGVHTWAQIAATSRGTLAHKWYEITSITNWCLSITINLYVTSMIIFRIWRVDKQSAEFRGEWPTRRHRSFRFIMRTIIDSALLYTTCSMFLFVTIILRSTVKMIAASMNNQVTGIAFNLILIRIAWYASTATEDPEQCATRFSQVTHVELDTLNRAAHSSTGTHGSRSEAEV